MLYTKRVLGSLASFLPCLLPWRCPSGWLACHSAATSTRHQESDIVGEAPLSPNSEAVKSTVLACHSAATSTTSSRIRLLLERPHCLRIQRLSDNYTLERPLCLHLGASHSTSADSERPRCLHLGLGTSCVPPGSRTCQLQVPTSRFGWIIQIRVSLQDLDLWFNSLLLMDCQIYCVQTLSLNINFKHLLGNYAPLYSPKYHVSRQIGKWSPLAFYRRFFTPS